MSQSIEKRYSNSDETAVELHLEDGSQVIYRKGVSPEWDAIIAEGVSPYEAPPEPSADDLRAQMKPISRRQLRLTLVRNGISLGRSSGTTPAATSGSTPRC